MPTVIDDLDRIAERVRHLRAERGLHQSELAEKAKVSRRTITTVESSKGRAYDATYGKIAAALGVPLAQLIGEENS